MRLCIPVFVMAGALAAAPVCLAQSSFGPEISAEDFHQHLGDLAVSNRPAIDRTIMPNHCAGPT